MACFFYTVLLPRVSISLKTLKRSLPAVVTHNLPVTDHRRQFRSPHLTHFFSKNVLLFIVELLQIIFAIEFTFGSQVFREINIYRNILFSERSLAVTCQYCETLATAEKVRGLFVWICWFKF